MSVSFDEVASLVNELYYRAGMTSNVADIEAMMRAGAALTLLIDEALRMRKSAWAQSTERCEALTLAEKVIYAWIRSGVHPEDDTLKALAAKRAIGIMLDEVRP